VTLGEVGGLLEEKVDCDVEAFGTGAVLVRSWRMKGRKAVQIRPYKSVRFVIS